MRQTHTEAVNDENLDGTQQTQLQTDGKTSQVQKISTIKEIVYMGKMGLKKTGKGGKAGLKGTQRWERERE